MRTTIKLADDVFRAFKRRAAERGTTFAQEVEDALRADLQDRGTAGDEEPFEVLVVDDGSRALIDIDDNRVLQELLDDEDRGARGAA